MQSLQLGLRSARLLSAACRSETLHEALSVAQRTMTMPCQPMAMSGPPVGYSSFKNAWLPRLWSGTTNAFLRQCLFEECVDVPVKSKVTAVLHTPTDVSITNGTMLRLEVQVSPWLSLWHASCRFLHSFAVSEVLRLLPCR